MVDQENGAAGGWAVEGGANVRMERGKGRGLGWTQVATEGWGATCGKTEPEQRHKKHSDRVTGCAGMDCPVAGNTFTTPPAPMYLNCGDQTLAAAVEGAHPRHSLSLRRLVW